MQQFVLSLFGTREEICQELEHLAEYLKNPQCDDNAIGYNHCEFDYSLFASETPIYIADIPAWLSEI